MKVSAGIVTYNNSKTIAACIESILRTVAGGDYDFRLYVYDNASTDDTVSIVKSFENVKVITSKINRGFGSGHNYIIRRVKSDIHFVINPDITLEEDAIGRLAETLMVSPDIGLITPVILSPDGSIQPIPKYGPSITFSFIGNLPGFKWLRRRYARQDENLVKPTDIEFCTGCFFAGRTDFLKKLRGFDSRFFLYCEDSDLSVRVLRTGKRIVYYPYASVYHNWERENTRNLKGFLRFVKSLMRYFHKWGIKF